MGMEQFIAFYLRISKAEEETKESDSIQNQRLLLENYLHAEKTLQGYDVEIFSDDGFSGFSENRPALQRMLSAVRDGKVYAVLVKDFSRLSRNHLYLAYLWEQFFPTAGTAFISLGEEYDSRKEKNNVLALRLKSLFHEYYCRDISRKVKAALAAKKENGEYAVAKPPLGYRVKNGRWELEEQEAALVQKIFKLAAEGYSNGKIVQILEKEAGSVRLYPEKVYRILQNPVYTGKRVWHKYESRMGFYKRSVALPREEWRVEEGNHPAIISEEIFRKVQH